MVHAKATNILASVYSGRLTAGREAGSGDSASVSGYSDAYALGPMSAGQPGKTTAQKASAVSMPGFELVPESRLDFSTTRPAASSPTTTAAATYSAPPGIWCAPEPPAAPPRPTRAPGPRPSSAAVPAPAPVPAPSAPPAARRQYSLQSGLEATGTPYNPSPVASSTPSYPSRTIASPFSPTGPPAPPPGLGLGNGSSRTRSPLYGPVPGAADSATDLVGHAAAMPVTTAAAGRTPSAGSAGLSRDQSFDRANARAPGMLGGGPRGYGNLPQDDQEQDPASYDYFRGARRNPSGWGAGPGHGGS